MARAMRRMSGYLPATQLKYMEMMGAEENNKKLFDEMMAEFEACFAECDANKSGVLDLAQFKTFLSKNNENMKRRFGESVKGDDREDAEWYAAYNCLTAGKEGVSKDDLIQGRMIMRKMMQVGMH